MTVLLLAHASAVVTKAYETACPGVRVVPFVAPGPGMSAAYDALAKSLGVPLLPALLKHLAVTTQPGEPVAFGWWSGGYAMARALARDPESRAHVAAWIDLDGLHTTREDDGTPSDTGLAWMVQLAHAALTGGAACAISHTDVATYGEVTSTTDSTREVLRLIGLPSNEYPHTDPADPRPRRVTKTWGKLLVAAVDTETDQAKEHTAALNLWGPAFVREALILAGLLEASTPAPVVAPVARPLRPLLLARGSIGEDVSELQRLLVVEADGRFGPGTERAVRAAQAAHGLVVDGIAGPVTLASLKRGMLTGVDVSRWNPDPGWPALVAGGLDFAAVRITAGSEVDRAAAAHLAGAAAAGIGLQLGYHYLTLGSSPQSQAGLFVVRARELETRVGQIGLAVDVEDLLPPAAPWPREPYAAAVLAFVREARRLTSRPCAVYGSGSYLRALHLSPELASEPLWLADWTPPADVPAPWTDWAILQYAVEGGLDRDRFRGTKADFSRAMVP